MAEHPYPEKTMHLLGLAPGHLYYTRAAVFDADSAGHGDIVRETLEALANHCDHSPDDVKEFLLEVLR